MGVIDAFGNPVSPAQAKYIAMVQTINGAQNQIWADNPDYNPGRSGSPAAAAPPHLQFSFDTIGQIIPRSLGHCRLPLKLIWVQGIDESGEWLNGLITTADAPAGSNVLEFGSAPLQAGLPGGISTIPPWVVVGINVTVPGETLGIPIQDGVTVGGISGTAIVLDTTNATDPTMPAISADIPAGTVIELLSEATAVTAVDCPIGTATLKFISFPAFLNTLSGIQCSGNGIAPGATVVSAGTDQIWEAVTMSASALVDIPAGTVVTFLKGSITVTFAAALCEPLDPYEEGGVAAFYSGANLIFTPSGGVTPPPSWSTSDQAQLIEALSQATLYPGTESQEPDPRIVADKGANFANAFRGMRYIVVPNYPVTGGSISDLSVVYQRSNAAQNVIAVTFPAGSS